MSQRTRQDANVYRRLPAHSASPSRSDCQAIAKRHRRARHWFFRAAGRGRLRSRALAALDESFDAQLGLVEQVLCVPQMTDALFEELHRLLELEIFTLEGVDD